MVDDNELKRLGGLQAPAPSAEAKARALAAAMQAFDEKNIASASQGSESRLRLTDRAQKIWREMMQKKLLAAPATRRVGRAADRRLRHLLPDGGLTLQFRRRPGRGWPGGATGRDLRRTREGEEGRREIRESLTQLRPPNDAQVEAPANYAAPEAELSRDVSGLVAPAPARSRRAAASGQFRATVATSKMMADQSAGQFRSHRHPAAGRRGPRPLRRVQDQPGALRCDRSGLDLLDRRRHGVLFLRAPLAEGRFPAAGRHRARRGDGQLLPL